MFERFLERGMRRERAGSPPEVVAQTVLKAMTARRPQARYLTGKDASALSTIARVFSTRMLDYIRMRSLGLPTRFGILGSTNT
jgi:hypothetical protein